MTNFGFGDWKNAMHRDYAQPAHQNEQHAMQQISREAYRPKTRFDSATQADQHRVNQEFGNLQIVDNGKPVQQTNFGGWRTGGMQQPNAENQSLMHTAQRTLTTNWHHQSYVKKDR